MADEVEVQYTADVSEFISGMDELTLAADSTMDAVTAGAIKAGEALDASLSQGAEKAKGSLESLHESGVNVGEMFDELKGKLQTAFEAGGVLIAYEAIKKVGEALEEVAEHATQINNLADVLGISVEQFQALEAAANRTGVGVSMVSRTVVRLEEDFRQAQEGSNQATEKLLNLGFSLDQINDKGLSASGMVQILADRLRDGATASNTMDAITAAFGSRAKLVAEVLKEYDGSAQGVAAVMNTLNGYTEEQVKQLHEAHGAWEDFKTTVSNTAGQMMLAFTSAAKSGYELESLANGIAPIVEGEKKIADAAVVASEEQRKAHLAVLKDAVDTTKATVDATKAGTQDRVDAERDYVAAVLAYSGERSTAYKASLTQLEVADREYYDHYLSNLLDNNAHAERAAEESDDKQREFAEKLSRDLDASMKRYWESQAKEQIDAANAQEKVTSAQLDSAKKVLDAQNASQKISPSTYLSAEIVLINEHRDAVIAAARAEEAARYGAADAAAAAAAKISVATATADAQIVAAQVKAAQEVQKNWQAVDNVIEKSLDGAFRTMLTSTGSFTANVRKSFLQMSETLIEGVFESMVKKWVEGEATKLAASQSMQALLTALHLTGLVQAKATDSAMAVSDITTKAAQAAAGAFAATAAIPYIGPELAPAAAAMADAEVMAYTAQIASAAGGMEVDRDQLAFVHKDEKILPAHISQGIDEKLLDKGPDSGKGGGGGGDHYHISAHDSKSFEKFLGSQRNRNSIAKATRKASNRGNGAVRKRAGLGR